MFATESPCPSGGWPDSARKRYVVTGASDGIAILTSPRGRSPLNVEDPEELVFCCFFRDTDGRTAFLDRLRGMATEAAREEPAQGDSRMAVAAEYARRETEGDSIGALFLALGWWVGREKRIYHVYRLKTGAGPYRTGCIISLAELDADELRWNLAFGVEEIEQTKARILDAFGFGI